MCSRQEVSQMHRGRIGAFQQTEPHPGGLSMGRGRGQSLFINTPILTCMSQLKEGAGADPCSSIPHPLNITPRLEGAMMALSGTPRQWPGVSGPMTAFQVLPGILFMTLMPPHYDDLFPPAMSLFVCGIAVPLSLPITSQNQ